MSSVPFAFTVDVEGAWLDFPLEQANFDPTPITAALKLIEDEIIRLEKLFSTKIPVTWFFRCDDSVAHSLGCEEGLLIYLQDFIKRRKLLGDAFGLHPHFYKQLDKNSAVWGVETTPEGQRALILRAAKAWKRFFNEPPKLSRMGEAIMSLAIAETLDEIGIDLDSTSLSGRERKGDGFFVNWLDAPHKSYKPCKQNYCKEATQTISSFQFTEAPFSMLPLHASYDKEPLLRYLNLAYHPEIVKKGLPFLTNKKSVITILHHHEIDAKREPGPLLTFQIDSVEKNIRNIISELGEIRFCTLLDNFFSKVVHNV